MRKSYTKPMIYAESFVLVEHVAACAPLSAGHNQNDIEFCGIVDSGNTSIFLDGVDNCNNQLGPEFTSNSDLLKELLASLGITCYNSAMDTAGSVLFGS